MKRYLIILTLYLCAVVPTMAQYYSVNYDKRTVEAMTAAFATEAATEVYYAEQVAKIREHYQAAEVAAAGIFSLLSSLTAKPSPIWDYGQVPQRTTITAVSITWCRPRLCRRFGLWQV